MDNNLEEESEKQKRLFVLGLVILFGWMAVIALCAYPQLFRDLLARYACCCFAGFAARRGQKCAPQKVAKARERVRSASKSFISVSLAAANPSSMLLKQVGLAELGMGTPVSDYEEPLHTAYYDPRRPRVSESAPVDTVILEGRQKEWILR